MIPALLNAVLLGLTGLLHLYWVLGGQWGWEAAIPEENGKKLLSPRKIDTLTVALVLLGLGAFHLIRAGWLALPLPNWLNHYGLWAIAGLFLLRAVGDFRYVGMFKRSIQSRFAWWDTRLFVPLCLLISANAFLTILLTN